MAVVLTQENINAAKVILEHDVINQIFDELVNDALEGAMNAGPLEHDLRAALLIEARTIRSLRSKLTLLKARAASLNDEGA